MKRNTGWVSVVVFVGSLLQAAAFDDGDWQLWAEVSLEDAVAEKTTFSVRSETRYGDDMSDRYVEWMQAGLAYALTPCLSVGAHYRAQYTRTLDGWTEEQRPMVEATFKKDAKGFGLKDRNLLEYRRRKAQDEIVRYRNKLTIELPLKLTAWKIRPYVADEIFIDSDQGELNRNRATIGLAAEILKARPELYVMWQADDKDGVSTDTYVAGVSLKFKL